MSKDELTNRVVAITRPRPVLLATHDVNGPPLRIPAELSVVVRLSALLSQRAGDAGFLRAGGADRLILGGDKSAQAEYAGASRPRARRSAAMRDLFRLTGLVLEAATEMR